VDFKQGRCHIIGAKVRFEIKEVLLSMMIYVGINQLLVPGINKAHACLHKAEIGVERSLSKHNHPSVHQYVRAHAGTPSYQLVHDTIMTRKAVSSQAMPGLRERRRKSSHAKRPAIQKVPVMPGCDWRIRNKMDKRKEDGVREKYTESSNAEIIVDSCHVMSFLRFGV
jgi:hypothetical protein